MTNELINAKLIELDSMTDKETGKPTIPVSIAIQEGEDVFGWCTMDKDDLIGAGLDWKFAEDLPIRIDTLKVSQANWKTEYKTCQDCQEEWKIAAPAAFNLRDELVHYFYHAFHNNQGEYAKVQRIAEGTKNAEMVQALLELSILGRKHTAKLEAIGLDLSLLDAARAKSFELGKLKSKVNIARKGTSPLLKIRDKAYTHLKEAVDEIRRIGQFYFWRDEDSLSRYVSQYNRKLNQTRKKSDEQPEA